MFNLEERFEEFQNEQKIKCDDFFKEDIMNITKNDTKLSCPPFFDSVLCWPRTAASELANLTCPLQTFSATAVATKQCLSNGEWFKNADGILWTNYSHCISSDGQFIVEITDSNLDFTKDNEDILNSTLTTIWLPRIKAVSQTGYVISCILLIIAFIIFSIHRRLQNTRNKLHMHLIASFILRAFMVLLRNCLFAAGYGLPLDVVYDEEKKNFVMKEYDAWFCKTITSIWQYCIVANYSWILMEGLLLHKMIFSSFHSNINKITFYVFLGWGIPAIIVIPWIILRIVFENVLCWTINHNYYVFLVIRIPLLIIIILNFLLFLNIVRVLYIKLKASVALQQKKMQYRKWARSTLILSSLLGIHYALLIGLSSSDDHRVELAWLFFDQLFSSFQGSFVAMLYCFLNGEVKKEVMRSWNMRKLKVFRDSSSMTNHTKPTWLKSKANTSESQTKRNLHTVSTA